ncbi:hypothetical protein [Neorhodopirellula pilleata]|uniref:Uncharacterized protein n=1 Tax=Neorhodopirellula pilleata TaxID=2714738 RepID=A0A5C6A1X3_9BACT|nr:hypothetical protein [Neorhodopirellula pilleata]TWT92503.1 hypothetical protein Pla100_45210 [Neorhodopirellula pilleata]
MNEDTSDLDPLTLDPPGTIAVLGTTPIGIEAALYGRYLGYDVTLIAGADVWQSRPFANAVFQRIGPTFRDDWFANHWLKSDDLEVRWNDPMPMMPDRCLSPLAFSAIDAQQQDRLRPRPSTIRQWIEVGLYEVIRTDLLRGRVFTDTFVKSIDLVAVEEDDKSGDDPTDDSADEFEEVPPDFLLTLAGSPLTQHADDTDNHPLRCECVIVADIPTSGWQRTFDLPTDYYFEIDPDAATDMADAEQWLRSGWQQIAAVYASLAGRPNLDLYRPRRT